MFRDYIVTKEGYLRQKVSIGKEVGYTSPGDDIIDRLLTIVALVQNQQLKEDNSFPASQSKRYLRPRVNSNDTLPG